MSSKKHDDTHILQIAKIEPGQAGVLLSFHGWSEQIFIAKSEMLCTTTEDDFIKVVSRNKTSCAVAVPTLEDELLYSKVTELHNRLWDALPAYGLGQKAADRPPLEAQMLAELIGDVGELQSLLGDMLLDRCQVPEKEEGENEDDHAEPAPEPKSKPEEDEPQPVLEDLDAAVHTPFKPLLGEWLGTRPADLGDRVVHNLSLREYPTYIYKFGGFGGEGCVRRAAKILGLYWQEDRMKRGEVLAVTVLLETEDGQIGYALFRKEDAERLMRWEVQPGHYLMLTYDGTQPYALDSMSNFKPITVCSMDDPALRPALAPEKRWVVLDSCADEGPDSSVAGFAKIGTEMWVEVPEDSRFVIGADPERAYLRVHKVYGPAFSIRALPVSAAAR